MEAEVKTLLVKFAGGELGIPVETFACSASISGTILKLSPTFYIAKAAPTIGEWRFGEGSVVHINAFEDEKPGTPLAEHFNEIAAKLKEIEAERQKECQAAEIPEEKN